MSKQDDVIKLLSEGEVFQAIDVLPGIVPKDYSLPGIKKAFTELEENRIAGRLSHEQYTIDRGLIIKKIIEIAKNI